MRSPAVSEVELALARAGLLTLDEVRRALDLPPMTTPPHIEAANLFVALLPEVAKYDRERRMQSEALSPDDIRLASDADLAARLRLKMKRGK